MKAALVIYGSLDSVSGGYLYDRMLVSKLRSRGDDVRIISQSRRSYAVSWLDNFRPDVGADVDVLIQDELNHPSLFLANRHRPRAPIVSIVHHLRSSEHRARWLNAAYAGIEQTYLRSVDGFIFNSAVTRDTVGALMHVEKPNVVATPGGDRFGLATPEQVQARNARGRPLRLVTVGNLIPRKGIELLLQALQRVPAGSVKLDVVGSEQAAPAFAVRMRAKAKSLEAPITFHGALGDTELREILQAADVFVMPSYYEGFGIAYLEAMSQGLAVIGAAAGAVPTLIRDGHNGYLIAPGSAAMLSDRISQLAGDRALLLRIRLNALQEAGSFPTWDQSTEQMRDFLLSMADRSRSEAA